MCAMFSQDIWNIPDLPNQIILKKMPSMRDFALSKTSIGGGEGVLYEIPNNSKYIAKIFKNPKKAKEKHDKVETLIKKFSGLINNNAEWKQSFEKNLTMPRARLYTEDSVFAGYIMNRVDLSDAITLKKFITEEYREYTKYNTWPVKLYVSLKLIQMLIKMINIGIFSGDLNESNFFVRKKTADIILIDCDSAQVMHEGNIYKLDAILMSIAPPELRVGTNNGIIDEKTISYSLAIILYRIFMKAYTPFNFRLDENQSESIDDLINKGKNVFIISKPVLPKGAPPLKILGPLKPILERSLNPDPTQRPRLKEIYMVLLDMYNNRMTKCRNGHYTPDYLNNCIVCGSSTR